MGAQRHTVAWQMPKVICTGSSILVLKVILITAAQLVHGNVPISGVQAGQPGQVGAFPVSVLAREGALLADHRLTPPRDTSIGHETRAPNIHCNDDSTLP
jgi:hypothetical protein